MQKVEGEKKYNLSFTAGGILHAESISVIESYLQSNDWSKVREAVSSANILAVRTQSSGKRLIREIELRLSWLDDCDLELIKDFISTAEQKQALWLCICKTYQFIADFMQEVVSDKLHALDYSITYDDYDRFYNAKSQWNEELDKLSLSTQKKIRQVLFRMLREMDILSDQNVIQMHNQVGSKIAYLSEKYGVNIKEILPAYNFKGAQSYA